MALKNYDLNIWDVWEYETEGKVSGGWRIDAYELALRPDGTYEQTDHVSKHSLWLKQHDVKMLGLVSEEPDFWSDAKYLLEEEDISRRVRIWLEKLTTGVLDAQQETRNLVSSWAS